MKGNKNTEKKSVAKSCTKSEWTDGERERRGREGRKETRMVEMTKMNKKREKRK